MRLSHYSVPELLKKTSSNNGIILLVGPFSVRLRTRNRQLVSNLRDLYQDFSTCSVKNQIVDFHIDMFSPSNHRRWIKPQINFSIDGLFPFSPFSVSHATPLFEWGFNWCIARNAQNFLLLHAAVLEKNNKSLILPALPGSGKSTLAAALSHSGWRFLSDEFCIIHPSDGKIIPIPRPTPLKNESIQIIRDFSPDAFIGPLFHNTRKGTIGHLRSPNSAIEQQHKPGTPRWIIFPRYQSNSKTTLMPMEKSFSQMKLASNAFNYEILSKTGFKTVTRMVDNCDCYNLTFSNLNSAISILDTLADNV